MGHEVQQERGLLQLYNLRRISGISICSKALIPAQMIYPYVRQSPRSTISNLLSINRDTHVKHEYSCRSFSMVLMLRWRKDAAMLRDTSWSSCGEYVAPFGVGGIEPSLGTIKLGQGWNGPNRPRPLPSTGSRIILETLMSLSEGRSVDIVTPCRKFN